MLKLFIQELKMFVIAMIDILYPFFSSVDYSKVSFVLDLVKLKWQAVDFKDFFLLLVPVASRTKKSSPGLSKLNSNL